LLSFAREIRSLLGRKCRDAGDERRSADRLLTCFENLELLGAGQRLAFAERPERDEPLTAGFDHRRRMFGKELVIDGEIRPKGSRDCRENALPFHREPAFSFGVAPPSGPGSAQADRGVGRNGTRTESDSQPKRNSRAGPQTLPWHGPMPAREYNF